MAALWEVIVTDLNDSELSLQVDQVHPDAGFFSREIPFALRMLHEPGWKFGASFNYEALGELNEKIDRDQIQDEDWLKAKGAEFISKVEVRIEREAVDEEKLTERLKQQLGFFGSLESLSEAERSQLAGHYDAFWANPDQLPRAHYRVQATSPQWLNHLTVGQRWRSAAY